MSEGACREPEHLRISWSNLQAHELCAQKAKLLRARKKSPTDDVRNFFHGIVADRVMRAWLFTSPPLLGEMARMVPDYVGLCEEELAEEQSGVVRWRSRTDRAELVDFCRTCVTRLEPMLARWVLPYEYEPEHRFRVPLRIPYLDGTRAEIELVGGIDILVRECADPPLWRAYDLKATDNPEYVRKTLAQGIFYDLAILAGFGRSPADFTFLQPMVADRPFETITVSDAERRAMLARIVAVAHDRWRGLEAPKASAEGCSRCPVRAPCVKFSSTEATVFRPVRSRRLVG